VELDGIFNSKKLALITLLGTVAFVSNAFLPSPADKMFIVIQALAFALGSLAMAKSGAMFAALVNGILLSVLRAGFFPFSLIFSVAYGLLIEVFFQAFKVNEANQIRSKRLIFALALASGVIGLLSMYLTTLLKLVPMAAPLYVGVLVVGVINGVAAGYLAVRVWNKYLKAWFTKKYTINRP